MLVLRSWIESSIGGTWIWGGGASGSGGGVSRWHVGVAVGVTAMAGLALAATIVISSRRGSLKSPWSRRKRKRALTQQLWKSLFTLEGKLQDGGVKFLKKVRTGGIDPSIRAEVWPFLLGVFDLNSTEAERNTIRLQKRKEYEKLRRRCRRLLLHTFDDKEMKGIDEVCNVESPSFSEGPESEEARPSLSTEQESSENGNSNQSGITHADASTSMSHNLEEDKTDASSSKSHNLEDDKTDASSSKSHNLEEDKTDASSSKTHNLEEDKTVTVHDDESGITYLNASVVDTDASGAETSSEDTETESRYSKTPPLKRTTEDFATWQRIIRLDAIRANSEWIIYSPSQAAVSEEKALELAVSVGLKDYEHLEPCRIYHASRLVAILEAYALYDPEIGYCQGMSDLLSPLLAVMEEDDEAFWCFVGFMKKARHNFRLDEVGIRRQLNIVSKIIKFKDSHLYRHLEKLQAQDCFFVYRMVVVLFRRELDFEQTLCLWEAMWADQAAIRAGIGKSALARIRLRAPPTDDLLLYAIAACVLQRRKLIIESYSSMDEIIRECNNMAGRLDVWKLLDDAHDLVVGLHDKI